MTAPAPPRRGRTVPAAIVALVLAGGAASVVVDVVAVGTTHHAVVWPYRLIAGDLRSARWDDAAVMAVAGAFAALGLVLVAIALSGTRRRLVTLRSPRADLDVRATRRSIRRVVVTEARGVDGVIAARVRLRRWGARVRITTPLVDTAEVTQRVEERLGGLLEQLTPGRQVQVRARARGSAGSGG